MNQQSIKSAQTAGLLGIFLGAFGGHNWYLGQKSKGIIHVCIAGGGMLLAIIGTIIDMNTPKNATSLIISAYTGISAPAMGAGFIMTILGSLTISGSAIWGLIEGIIILSKGDAGLAAQGYTVAAPAVAAAPVAPVAPAAPIAPAAPVAPVASAPVAPAPVAPAEPIAPAAPVAPAEPVAPAAPAPEAPAPEAPTTTEPTQM